MYKSNEENENDLKTRMPFSQTFHHFHLGFKFLSGGYGRLLGVLETARILLRVPRTSWRRLDVPDISKHPDGGGGKTGDALSPSRKHEGGMHPHSSLNNIQK